MDLVSDPASRAFGEPDARFRPAAYWFWHGIPELQDMRRQLADFRSKGFRTILIQCRLAFPRSLYLSAEFLTAYRQAVEIMAELGLTAGLYDDYNWNSGQAGGRTVSGADECRERHLFWVISDTTTGAISEIVAPFSASMGKDIGEWLYEGGVPRFDDWQLVSAIVFRDGVPHDQMEDVSSRVMLTDSLDGCSFLYDRELPEGWKLLVSISARCVTSRLINYLLPEAGERFVEVGLEPYAEVLEGLIPGVLSFLFYDQPAAGFYKWRQMQGDLGNSLLYAPLLKHAVESECNQPFGMVLLALLKDVGSETAELRSRFYRTYSELLCRGFFKPVRDFCRKHGLRFTGHEILPHVGGWALNGGFTSIDPRVAPAVDFFGLDAMRDETAVDANNFESQLSPKLGDSVARANGRSRAIVELYATATRTERRGAGQWELTPATLRAQSIRLHLLGARQILIHALYQTDGTPDNHDLFVNPRFDFAPGINFEPWWPHYRSIADESARLSAFLEDLKPETPVALVYPLETAMVMGPRHDHARDFGTWCEILEELACGYMIVDEAALEAARIDNGFLYASGLRFAAVALPSVSRLADGVRQKLVEFQNAGGQVWASGDATTVEQLAMAGPSRVNLAKSSIAKLVDNLPKSLPDLVASPSIRRVCGKDEAGYWRYALFNDSSAPQSVQIADIPDVEVWNCCDGEIARYGDASRLTIELEGHELICLRFRAGSGAGTEIRLPAARFSPTGEHVLDRDWSFRMEEGAALQAISVDRGWQQQGHADYSGVGIYTCRFHLQTAVRTVLEFPGLAVAVTVLLDGKHIGERGYPPYRVSLGDVSAGRHEIELRVANTAANRYYAGTPYAGEIWPDQSGLTAPPILKFHPIDGEDKEF